MKKVLCIVLLASLFIGCGYEIKPKGEVEKVTTVHIMDVGNFQVVGEVTYLGYGTIEFTEKGGMEITTHIQRCVIVEAVPKPTPPQPPQVKAPAQKPKKIPEKETK